MNLWTWQETVIQDLRYGVRELLRNKGFTITADRSVITLSPNLRRLLLRGRPAFLILLPV
jgi:hypothetical protein